MGNDTHNVFKSLKVVMHSVADWPCATEHPSLRNYDSAELNSLHSGHVERGGEDGSGGGEGGGTGGSEALEGSLNLSGLSVLGELISGGGSGGGVVLLEDGGVLGVADLKGDASLHFFVGGGLEGGLGNGSDITAALGGGAVLGGSAFLILGLGGGGGGGNEGSNSNEFHYLFF